jgi:hypothetical protein
MKRRHFSVEEKMAIVLDISVSVLQMARQVFRGWPKCSTQRLKGFKRL